MWFWLGVPNQRACGASPTSEKTRPWNFGPCTLCVLSFFVVFFSIFFDVWSAIIVLYPSITPFYGPEPSAKFVKEILPPSAGEVPKYKQKSGAGITAKTPNVKKRLVAESSSSIFQNPTNSDPL